jgi:hypothetical protein
MKKIFPIVILFLLAAVVWNVFISPGDMNVIIDGDEFDGPVGAVVGALVAGGGMLLAGIIVISVGAILALVFAGVGILLLGGLVLGSVALAAMLSPLMLPLLIPVGIFWFFYRRNQRRRDQLALPAPAVQA